MHNLGRHVPFALVVFIILFSGVTDLAIDAGPRILATLLAPALWLALYILGADHVTVKE